MLDFLLKNRNRIIICNSYIIFKFIFKRYLYFIIELFMLIDVLFIIIGEGIIIDNY